MLSPDKTDSIGYTLASQDNGSQNTTWKFTADEVNASGGTTKPVGVIVNDYSSNTLGTYEDTITFTASVIDTIVVSGYYQNASKPFSATATLNNGNLSVTSTSLDKVLIGLQLTYSDGALTIYMRQSSTNSKTVIVDLKTGVYTQTTSGNAMIAGLITLSGITINGNAITLTPAS